MPFLYSTNGEVIWHHDVRDELNRSRQIVRFHTPDAFAEMLEPRLRCRQCESSAPSQDTRSSARTRWKRTTRIEQAISRAQAARCSSRWRPAPARRFTIVNEIYRLMKSGVAKRILFLVDRRALAAQAVRAFASFEAEPGLKFDKIYEVYSQRFQREDFDEEEKFDPKVLPKSLPDDPQARQRVRLRLHDPADDDQPLRTRGGLRTGDEGDRRRRRAGSTSRSTPST